MIKFVELESGEILVNETQCNQTIWTDGFHRDVGHLGFDTVHNDLYLTIPNPYAIG